ncbi:MAG: hypothetical protein AAFR65_01010 [Pseudomonadota bacterium]
MAKDPNENPYWSPLPQGPVFDVIDVKNWCTTAFLIYLGSKGLNHVVISKDEAVDFKIEDRWVHPDLIELYQKARDKTLPTLLLRLAISFRVLQDRESDNTALNTKIEQIDANHPNGIFSWDEEDPNCSVTLRELCNKIIHGSDIRYPHDSDDPLLDGEVHSMTGVVEIAGVRGKKKKKWSIYFHLCDFLDAILEIAHWMEANQPKSQ